MKKVDEMKNKLETLKNEAQVLLDNNKVQDAQAKMDEVKNLKASITIQEELDQEEVEALENTTNTVKEKEVTNKTKENANVIRAMIKKVTGKPLTETENSLLLPTTGTPTGVNGESYILPQDIRTKIVAKIRQYKSIRDVVGHMPVSALTGSFPVENFESVTGLVDFADGTDGTDSEDIKFTNVSFALKEKAAFIKLSNTLLGLTDNALISYVVEIFSKKAVITENTMGVATLKSNKTVKKLEDWKALKKSINVDLDPAVLYANAIVTNQDGFDYLDSALDTTGRPILQPNPEKPTEKLFMGYPVTVYSNAMLPTTPATASLPAKSPIFYGALSEAVKFTDLDGAVAFATSSEAGFMSNTTIARLIEFIDLVQVDKSDKCYIYGELETAPKTGA